MLNLLATCRRLFGGRWKSAAGIAALACLWGGLAGLFEQATTLDAAALERVAAGASDATGTVLAACAALLVGLALGSGVCLAFQGLSRPVRLVVDAAVAGASIGGLAGFFWAPCSAGSGVFLACGLLFLGCVAGRGLVCLVALFSQESPGRCLECTALAGAVGLLISSCGESAADPLLSLGLLCAATLVGGGAAELVTAGDPSFGEGADGPVALSLRELASLCGEMLLSVAVMATALDCFSVMCTATEGRSMPNLPIGVVVFVGYALIFIAARRSVRHKTESRVFFVLFRLGLPALVCIALSMKVVPVELISDGAYLQTIRVVFGLSLVGAWAIAAQSCVSAGPRGTVVGACLVGVCAAAGLLGLALVLVNQTVLKTVMGLVTACFCLYACMALGKVLIDYHRPVDIDGTPEPDEGATGGRPDIDDRCDALAGQFTLSRRERDVLGELARGHSSGHIATTFCISPNTARTHMRNIYKKLGVSSREELAALIWDGIGSC